MSQSPDEARLAEILADLYDADPEEGRHTLEQAIRDHPDLADDLRSHAEMLDLVSEAFGAPETVSAGMPSDIAGYRLLEVLGRGGMATVYRAAQDEPVHREVAVKILHQRLHGPQALARFEVERETLARMDHPSIAHVLDAGFTSDSVPYVVMELVDGEPITDYCERVALPLEARLQLFADVCEAVQHAHQKGVIHRDLKPTNVLVTDANGAPHVKVIDFGLAKALDDSFAGDGTLTVDGQILGTPAYMSPEQATGGDVDATTDVYGLGMLLYELLVGEIAWDRDSVTRENFAQFVRRLADEEPPKPSARLSTLHGLGAPASPSWERRLRGELDWITMKALAKERERRYATPRELAEDVHRFLRHEPVRAGPPSTGYRMRKFVRRHRAGVLAATIAILALAASSVISARFAGQARDTQGREAAARIEAEATRDKAEATRDKAEELTGYILAEFQQRLTDIGRLDVMEGVANRALAYYETAYEPEAPEAVMQRAEALYQIGNVLWKRSDRDAAVASYRLADELAAGLLARRPGARRPRLLRAFLAQQLSAALAQAGDEAASEAQFARAQKLARELVAEQPTRKAIIHAVGLEKDLAMMERRAGHWEAAEARVHDALAELDRVEEEDQSSLIQRMALVSQLARWVAERMKPEEATSLVAETIERVDAFHRAGRATLATQLALMELLNTGSQLVRPHDLELAARTVELGRSLVDSHPQVAKCRVELTEAHRTMATGLIHAHQPDEAAKHASAAVESARILNRLDTGWSARYLLAASHSGAGQVLGILRRHEDSLEHGRAALKLYQELAVPTASPSHRTNMAGVATSISHALLAMGRPEEAEEAGLEALDHLAAAEAAGADSDSLAVRRVQALLAAAAALIQGGSADKAQQLLHDALDIVPKPSVNPWFLLEAQLHERLAYLHMRNGDFKTALQHANARAYAKWQQSKAEPDAPSDLGRMAAWEVRTLRLLVGEKPLETPRDHAQVAYLLHTRAGSYAEALKHWRAALADQAVREDLGQGYLYHAAASAARAAAEASGDEAQALREVALQWLAEDRAMRRTRMSAMRAQTPPPADLDKQEASYARLLEHARLENEDLTSLRDLPAFQAIFEEQGGTGAEGTEGK